jgi:hypothetical protein
MRDLIVFLATVNWPGAAIVIAAIGFGAWVVVQCYGRNAEGRQYADD